MKPKLYYFHGEVQVYELENSIVLYSIDYSNIQIEQFNKDILLRMKLLDYFEDIEEKAINRCTCPINTLVQQGCTCGSIRRYRGEL